MTWIINYDKLAVLNFKYLHNSLFCIHFKKWLKFQKYSNLRRPRKWENGFESCEKIIFNASAFAPALKQMWTDTSKQIWYK